MSGTEIERKFLIRKGADFKTMAVSCSHIRQGYMPCESATVRVRTRDDRAYLTIKGRSNAAGLSRYEFEKQITLDEAEHLLLLCRGGMIDKHRYLVPSGQHTFEVDEFHGDNEGLLMAEVELGSEDEAFVKPRLWAWKSRATAVSTILTCLFPLIRSGAILCQKNTDSSANRRADGIGCEIKPFAAATTARAVGLQQFNDSAHYYGCKPGKQKKLLHVHRFVAVCIFPPYRCTCACIHKCMCPLVYQADIA